EETADPHHGLAAVKGVGHQADRQFGELFFEALSQPLESLEFAILLFGLRVHDIHFLVQEGQERTFRSNNRELQHVPVAASSGGGLAPLCKALTALFLNAAI